MKTAILVLLLLSGATYTSTVQAGAQMHLKQNRLKNLEDSLRLKLRSSPAQGAYQDLVGRIGKNTASSKPSSRGRNRLEGDDSGWGTSSQAQLLYFGGPVIANVKIYAVYWGSDVDGNVQSKMGNFYSTITNSPYMDWLGEYNTDITAQNGQPGTSQAIGRGSFGGDFIVSPSTTATTVDDTDIQNELANQINQGNLPPPDDNSLYMVHFPPGLDITLSGGGGVATSCQDFCAYHNSARLPGGQNLYYGVMPDFGGACSGGCGTADQFGNFTSAASHEMTEAITDPQVGNVPGSGVDYPMAWYDPNQGEIGDICTNSSGTITATDGTQYIVQGEWSNAQSACVTGL